MQPGKSMAVTWVTLFAMISVSTLAPVFSYAQSSKPGFSFSEELRDNIRGSEYVSGKYPGAVLMKVNLWGAVQKPGIHHIPVKTDLITLLSYAGGPLPEADLDEVFIKRKVKDQEIRYNIDVEEMLGEEVSQAPRLLANDIVVVPGTEPAVSSNTVVMVGLISSIAAILVSGAILANQISK